MRNKGIAKLLWYDPEIEHTYHQNRKEVRENKSVTPIAITPKIERKKLVMKITTMQQL